MNLIMFLIYQIQVQYFEKKYKELYGKNLGDIRDKNDREQIFLDFVDELVAQGKSDDDARNEFEKYFY